MRGNYAGRLSAGAPPGALGEKVKSAFPLAKKDAGSNNFFHRRLNRKYNFTASCSSRGVLSKSAEAVSQPKFKSWKRHRAEAGAVKGVKHFSAEVEANLRPDGEALRNRGVLMLVATLT